MNKRKSQPGRLIAAVVLPFVMSACMTWQPLELANLRQVIFQDRPKEIRLRTRSGDEFDVRNPRVSRDTIFGPDGPLAGIPLVDVAEASLPKVDIAQSVLGALGVVGAVGMMARGASPSEPLGN